MISAARGALMAGSLLLATPAMAAPQEGGHYVWVPAGATVVLVPQVEQPMARMIAQHEAMMQRMFADIDALMAMPIPDPGQAIRAAMEGMPQARPGSGVVVTSITTGRGTCSQTITYAAPGSDGAPVVNVRSTGNACGAIGMPAPVQVLQPAPQPPQIAPRHERLWTVGDPPRPIRVHQPPRT